MRNNVETEFEFFAFHRTHMRRELRPWQSSASWRYTKVVGEVEVSDFCAVKS